MEKLIYNFCIALWLAWVFGGVLIIQLFAHAPVGSESFAYSLKDFHMHCIVKQAVKSWLYSMLKVNAISELENHAFKCAKIYYGIASLYAVN